jgi:alpha-L-fucosidase
MDMNIQSHDLASWPIEWSTHSYNNPNISTKEDMIKFREYYFGLSKKFKPEKFDPSVWAEAAHRAGMRYVVMTTKHHDGFNMYATDLDDYSVVGKNCPFQTDAFGQVMKAFRDKNFFLGAYYSKADWHRKDFWKDGVFAESNHANYETEKEPERWNSFKKYVHGQIYEIMTQYNVDLLWFDGAWVRPTFEDLDMPQIAKIARGVNPDVLLVNRMGGVHEDYITPEQGGIPSAPLQKPWEICMTMGTQWAYKKGDHFKDTKQILSVLIASVASGGNLLLDVGPQPDGQLPADAISRLTELGDWMDINAEAIHDTEPVAPYHFYNQLNFTTNEGFYLSRKNRVLYIFYMNDQLPDKISMQFMNPNGVEGFMFKVGKIRLLGTSSDLPFYWENHSMVIHIPRIALFKSQSKYVVVFKVTE